MQPSSPIVERRGGLNSASKPAQQASETIAESAPQGAGKHVFDIQFVPTEFSAKGDGVANLLDELRSMGTLEIVNQPEAEMRNVGYWQVRLLTALVQDDFSDQIDFIAENGAWRIVEDVAASPDGDAAFGFFGDSPGAPDDNQGYGFFAPLSSPASDSGDGYGFFEPLPVPHGSIQGGANANEDGDGYGFFAPLAPPAVGASMAEEGDGFGFFAPLPPPLHPKLR